MHWKDEAMPMIPLHMIPLCHSLSAAVASSWQPIVSWNSASVFQSKTRFHACSGRSFPSALQFLRKFRTVSHWQQVFPGFSVEYAVLHTLCNALSNIWKCHSKKCSRKEQKGTWLSLHCYFFLVEHLTTVEEIKLQWGKVWTASDRNTHMVLFVSVETAMQTSYSKYINLGIFGL